MFKRSMRIGLILAVTGLLSGVLQGQIPTVEERIRDSGLNPEYNTWRAKLLRLTPDKVPDKGEPEPVAGFRKDFKLTAPPREAAISLLPVGSWSHIYRFRVNGRLVAETRPKPRGSHRGLRNLDLTDYLQAGDNVITFEWTWHRPRGRVMDFAAEGLVLTEDGGMLRLLTDGTWKGGLDLPEGWDSPDTDPATLPEPSPAGNVRWSSGMDFIPPYYGKIRVAPVGMDQPIFDEEKSVELEVSLLNTRGSGQADAALALEIMDQESRAVLEHRSVPLSSAGKWDYTGVVTTEPLPRGTYRFRFVLSVDGTEIDRRDYEVAVVGEIKQRMVDGTHFEDGLELREIWSVDCAEEPDTETFIATDSRLYKVGKPVETRVVEGPAGRYRELAETRHSVSMGYRYKHRQLFVPHLVVIEWPDDTPRSFQATILEGTSMVPGYAGWPSRGAYQRGDAVIVHVDEHPLSGEMQKLHLLYWPNEEDAAVHIWNLGGAGIEPPAVARITVYEILNDLPALRIACAGDRMMGYQTERGPQTMSAGYYAGPLGAWFCRGLGMTDHPEFYRNWHTTTENMIKRMRFSGQNMYLMGHFMYSTVLYPSRAFPFAQNTYIGGDANRDYMGLILRMFERNSMRLISSLEYISTPDLLAESTIDAAAIRAGEPTLHQVHRNGTAGGIYDSQVNFMHPRVQQSVLTVVDELLELYAEYPAWRGINFILHRGIGGPIAQMGWGDASRSIDWGYEDYTIDLFEKTTGSKIPVAGDDPERFEKRYQWLMANARSEWIDWRCAQLTKLYREIRDRIVSARPDLKLYLTSVEPTLSFSQRRPTKFGRDMDGHYHDGEYIRTLAKTFGLDIETLREEPGIILGYAYQTPGGNWTKDTRHEGWREVLHSDVWHNQFANDGKGGAFVMTGIAHHPTYRFAPGEWIFERQSTRQGYLWPRYFSDAFINVLARSNPTWLPHTWQDIAESSGRLHEMRLFARAYRSLPNGKYERLVGRGLDENIWISRTFKDGVEYAYAANLQWWETEITLTFASGVGVHDLISDEPVVLRENQWSFRLEPYSARTFMVSRAESGDITAGKTGNNSIIAASATVPDAAIAATEKALENGLRVVNRARAREEELKRLPGWERVEEMEGMIAEIERLQKAGDVCRAYELATSWEFKRRQEQVINEALEALPFLVLGPFGVPEDTVGAGEIFGNVEVIPEFEGMETPYIGEFKEGDPSRLLPGFKVSADNVYHVYPEREASWSERLKTYYFKFYPDAHSEPPLWMTSYAYTEVYSPQTRQATILVGSDHAIWVWVNGRLVVKYGGQGTPRGGQRPGAPDQNRGNFRLQQGWNRVLVKAVQRGEAGIFFRISDMDGNAIDDLRFRVQGK